MATADSAALDDFLNTFRTQVDTGFGLISGDVGGVFGLLVVISVAMTALLWAIDETQNVTAAFIRKILIVGFFAWLISSWHSLSVTIVEGFTALGLKAGSGSLSLADFMTSPSKIVGDGFKDAFQLIQYIGKLSQEGYGLGFFNHFDVILVAAVAAIGIILAFIILGVELAVTIIEFHIVTLIAFVTVPFGILAQTAFMSERAIGYVVSVGIKLMALALVVSIGESVFTSYVVSADPTVPEECGLLLASVVMLMLALKIPGIAGALISGGPQLSGGSTIAGAAALAAGVGGMALAGRMAGAVVARGVAQGSDGASKVSAANAAAGAGSERSGSAPPGGGGSLGGGGDDGGGGGGAGPTGSSGGGDGSSGGGPAPVSAAETLASIRRAPVQSLIAAGVRGASGAARGSAGANDDESAPAPPPPPAPSQTVANLKARRSGVPDVVAMEGARMASQAHEDGGGAGMSATLHPNDPKSE
jgi:type IV secretion system protein TrbL